ncbi:MAG: glycine--tRNA ligase subunit beta [Syntrophaceae bacterium]|nr:glycine--tRNA ligase subunit beta [Syntrophaceae bacterium]
MKELLLEIGTEEIPAGFVPQALNDFASLIQRELEANRIDFDGVKTLGTPRRLVLYIQSVSERQRDEEIRRIGPPKRAAFDSKGNPTQAAIGFAKSQSVPLESLEVVQTEKGEYICALKKELGRPTPELLPSVLPKVILSIPFQKSMRWADIPVRFARPIHWILALFGGVPIPFEIGNIRSGDVTFGHRFMHAGPVRVNDFNSYLRRMREAFVIVDPVERRKRIEEEMVREAASVSGRFVRDEELLDEVNFLVEYPVAMCGRFDEEFLSLPGEVLIHSMKEHQRYFPVVDESQKLLPYFVFVSNIIPKDRKVVIKGNERVLKARLSDAAYFFREDLKVPLEKRVEELKHVVFQAKLGTSYEKMTRFRQLALFICERIDPGLRSSVERASFLCKADLVTGMVGEFPKLQGIVGREYARLSGERPEVAEAIYEHYLPGFAGDRLPSGPIGDIISIADKMDTIVGSFGIGLVPTGTADPFGLRRQALGIIRIILEKGYSLSLTGLIQESGGLLKEKMERPFSDVEREVLEFFRVRYQHLLLDRGYPLDVIEAVLSVSFDDLLDVQRRIDALNRARGLPDLMSVVIAFKRAVNILKESPPRGTIQVRLFSEPAEHNLYQSFVEVEGSVTSYLSNDPIYDAAIREMLRLKEPIDEFFDKVMVMVEDEAIRNNRLALLDEIGKLFLRVADFSKLT